MYINIDVFFSFNKSVTSDLSAATLHLIWHCLLISQRYRCLLNEACFVFLHFVCHLFSALTVVVLLMRCFSAGFLNEVEMLFSSNTPPYLPLPAHCVPLLPQHEYLLHRSLESLILIGRVCGQILFVK